MEDQAKDYYIILGVERLASEQQIKKAYKKLARVYHPDKNNSQECVDRFREITQAYEVLVDAQKRKNYDIYGLQLITTGRNTRFNYNDAETLFRNFFETNYEDKEMDEESADSFQYSRRNPNYHANSMFGGPANDFGFFSSFSKENTFHQPIYNPIKHLSDIGGQGISKSVSTVTKTVNGKTITIRRTTIKKVDGTKDVTEQIMDQYGVEHKMYTLAVGEGFGNRVLHSH